jgi:hypothetical protein
MSHWKQLLAALALTSLAACGGGGGDAGTPGMGGAGPADDLVITFDKAVINNSGTDTVTATITAVDAKRNGVKGVSVSVSVDANAVIAPSTLTTGEGGKIAAAIGIGSDRSTRTLTVTARSGGITRTAELSVVAGADTPLAADLALTLSGRRIMNGTSDTVTAVATAVDANRNVLAGIPVTLSVDAGAILLPSGPATDVNGVVTGIVSIGADRSNRYVTVTARSGSLVQQARFLVDGARLFASASPLVSANSAGNTVEYTLFDSSDKAMGSQAYTVSGSGLTQQSGKTDDNGKFRYTYTAPSTAGNLTITATAAGAVEERVVVVSAAGLPPAAEMPRSATVRPTPSVIAVNSPNSTTNQVELRALFIGTDDRPIQNMRARFDIVGGAPDTYGTVNVVGSYAYSDVSGVARATFVPGTRQSPTNGVTVRVCYDQIDFATPAPNSCAGAANTAVSTLTVSKGAISVNIRTNNQIGAGLKDLTYIKEYVVSVVDSAGNAVSNAEITPSVDLLSYYKGFWVWSEAASMWVRQMSLAADESYRWNGATWEKTGGSPRCPNEDWNRNGVLENLGGIQEDLNGNGEIDPRKSDVAVKMAKRNDEDLSPTKTDKNGLAVVQIEYGKSLGSWVDFDILVTASASGTEGRTHYMGLLPVSTSELTNKTQPPSFVTSPYGISSSCANPN